jgi:hypothetical protein
MTADRIERDDAAGDAYELMRGAPLRRFTEASVERGAVAGVRVPDSCIAAFTEEQAGEVASFLAGALSPKARLDLLEEVAPGLAGAARRVAEAAARGRFQCWSEAEQALLDALVAELTKLEGGT